MATKKKMLQAAAGNAGGAGGASLNVEDVFSTYLYEGTGATQSIENGIALGDFGRGTSTLFGDGAFLNRTSDLTGNSDGKTLTLSVWVFPEEDANQSLFAASTSSGGNTVYLSLDDTQKLALNLHNSSGTTLLNLESRATQGAGLPLKAWSHVLISVDLSNTSNRHLYINDAIPAHVDWSQYNNGTVDFTQPKWGVAGSTTTASDIERMAHLYFDYTYRDLSVASNRRHFIDANGGSTSSSTQSALNPIIYLPLTEDYTTGKNLGTGGDFTINGSPTVLDTGTEYEDGYGEGGLVWTKIRTQTANHYFWDTERGVNKRLSSNQPYGENNETDALNSFNSNGFTLGSAVNVNGSAADWGSAADYTSWTWRKAPKFFDVIQYVGDGVAGRTISHNLDATPGMIIVKRTNANVDWICQHRSLSAGYVLYLNQTSAQDNNPGAFTTTLPTSSVFSVGDNNKTNQSGGEYVAYVFAHNDGDGEFGPASDQDIIKCGSIVGNGASDREIDLGFEPQWLLIRRSNSGGSWALHDNMRGMIVGGADPYLLAQDTSAEGSDQNYFEVTPNGFKVGTAGASGYAYNESGDTYIYMAIRRGTKVPESATEVFGLSGDTVVAYTDVGFPVDMVLGRTTNSTQNWRNFARMIGGNFLVPNLTNAEASLPAGEVLFDSNDGFYNETNGTPNIWYQWKRAPGFFDVVAYSGSGSSGLVVNHNLGVSPELLIFKNRGSARNWFATTSANYGQLNESDSFSSPSFMSFSPTTFTINTTGNSSNASGQNYIAYLFASLDGISKVGSYTGNGSSQTIDCGFSNSARFVLLKRTDSTGDWFVFDATRGITVGSSDPILYLNSTTQEYAESYWDAIGADMIQPHSSGFKLVQSSLTNNSTGSYIFYAIA